MLDSSEENSRSNGGGGDLLPPEDPEELSTTVTEIVIEVNPAVDEPPKEPESLPSESRRLFIICPSCLVKVPFEGIGEHILASHPGLVVVEVGPSEAEVEELVPETETLTPEESETSSAESANQRVIIWDPSQARRPSVHKPTPASDACVPCTAPGCRKFVHQSNLPRHWRSWHPGLNRADFPNRLKPKPKPQPTNSKFASVDQIIKVEVGENVIDFQPNDVLDTSQNPTASNLPLVNGLYVCAFEGCDYSSKFNSNMWRHKRKFNHCVGGDAANRTF